MRDAIGLTAALLLLLAWIPSRSHAQCEVRGVATIPRLRLRIPGEALRTLAVTDLPVAVRPGRGDRYRDIRVLAPLAFAARTDARIPWTIPRPGAVAGDTVWLTPRVEVEDVREQRDGEELSLRVQVDAGVWISRIVVPCEGLAVGHGEGGDEAPAWDVGGGPRWVPQHERIWFFSAPDRGPSVRLDAPDGLGAPLVEVERRLGWVRVATRFPSGAALRGWVREHDLRAAHTALEPRTFRRAAPQTVVPVCRRHPPERDEYVGPARVAIGTIVQTERGSGPAWASVSEPTVVTVSWHTGSEWARIVHVPGVRDDGPCPEVLGHAWVPRTAVSLHGEASTSINSLLGLE